MILVTLKIVFRKSANMDLRGEEKRTSVNLKGIIGLVKKLSICFPNGGLHIEGKIMPHSNKKREEKNTGGKQGKRIKTLC